MEQFYHIIHLRKLEDIVHIDCMGSLLQLLYIYIYIQSY